MSKLESFFKGYASADEELNFEMASERVGKKIPSIPTGSLLLDDILGCGGWPCGRVVQLYGSAGSGKSLLSMLAIKEAQKLNSTSQQVVIDSENTFNVEWSQSLGLDIERIIIIDKDLAVNARRCFEMLLGEPKEDAKHVLIGKKKEGLLDQIISKNVDINLIILDSLGAQVFPIEDVANIGKSNIASMARFLSSTLKKLSLEVSKANIPFLIINHKRENMDPYGVSRSFAGGNSYSHFLSANVFFESVMRKDAVIVDEKENKIGHTIRATTDKSKFSVWPKKCEFKVNFNIGIVDIHEEIVSLALDYNVIKKVTSMSYEYEDKKWVGLTKVNEAVQNDPALAEELKNKIEAARDSKRESLREAAAPKLVETEVKTKKKSTK